MDSSYLEEEDGESASAMSPPTQESSATESLSTAANRQGLEEGISDDELQLQIEAWKEAARDRPL